MIIIHAYVIAVLMCIVTMICWGSWANTKKLVPTTWSFQLFYWDYTWGVFFVTLLLALTMGSIGEEGRSFIADLQQAEFSNMALALLGGIIFNFSNLLLVAVIDLAGMVVAFPIVGGLALVIGVIINYLAQPIGHPVWLFSGVGAILIAIFLTAYAYKKLQQTTTTKRLKAIFIAIIAGVLMGSFYRLVAASIATDFVSPPVGKLTPYTAVFIFVTGMLLSNFIWNTWLMKKPIVGEPVAFSNYFKVSFKTHMLGMLGGAIWGLGTLFNFVAAGAAGFAISYGLGQGATMVAVAWGVFVWKEFAVAPVGTMKILSGMFIAYMLGIIVMILSRVF